MQMDISPIQCEYMISIAVLFTIMIIIFDWWTHACIDEHSHSNWIVLHSTDTHNYCSSTLISDDHFHIVTMIEQSHSSGHLTVSGLQWLSEILFMETSRKEPHGYCQGSET